MIAVSRKPHLKIAHELCSKNLMTEQPMEKFIEFCSRHMRLWLMYRVFSSIKCHLLCGLALKFHKFVYTNAKVTCKITCCITENVELLNGNLTHCGLNQKGFIFVDRSLPSTFLRVKYSTWMRTSLMLFREPGWQYSALSQVVVWRQIIAGNTYLPIINTATPSSKLGYSNDVNR